jgi:hypothetical protein
MIKPKVVLLIFVSGKIVLTGAKVSGPSLDVYLLFLHVLTFPSACEGAGGDIHGVQHDLHRAMRVPQAVRTASRCAPPRPREGGIATWRYHMIARLWIPWDLTTLATVKTGWRSLLRRKSSFCPLTHAHSPFPLPSTYIFAIPYYKIHTVGLLVLFVLVIALSMTVYIEALDDAWMSVTPVMTRPHGSFELT